MTDQNIKDKIKKLFALAACKGASEDEAATAMRMAAGLMMKHGLSQDQLGGEVPKAKKGAKINSRFEKYQIILAAAAAHLYGCKVIFWDGGKGGIAFVGRLDNIDASEATMMFLTQQLEQLYKQALPKGLSQKARSDYRKTFKWACAIRVEQRVKKLMDDLQRSDAAAQAATGRNALVVQGHFKQLLAEVDETLGASVRPVELKQRLGSGTDAGLQAGDKVRLRNEVTGTHKQLTH